MSKVQEAYEEGTVKSSSPKTTAATTIPVPPIEVRIQRILPGENKVKAYASVTVGGAFAMHGLRLVEGENGLIVRMPSKSYQKDGETKYSDICPITKEAYDALNAAVNEAYTQAIAEMFRQSEFRAPATGGYAQGMEM